MDLKLIADLQALHRCGSYVQAAAERHVTHPAFGRRIRALQAWAGVALVESGRAPVRLTPAGLSLLDTAAPLLATLERARHDLQAGAGRADGAQTLRVGTGRTLARTLVADWLVRQRTLLRGHRTEIVTRSMAEIVLVFERGEVDLLCCYEHPALSTGLAPQRFRHLTLAMDRLLPVSRADANGRPRHALAGGTWIDYAPTLSLGRLLADHLASAPAGERPPPAMVCDSADAMLELALKGLGLAWLPASLAAGELRRGLLVALGGRGDQIPFEVRLYRQRSRQSPLVEAVWAAGTR
jgi:LysR family transcriptional regulator, hypochlorite-specific transcription factor HypT